MGTARANRQSCRPQRRRDRSNRQGSETGWDKHDAALLQAADDLREKSVVADETWQQLSQRYSVEQMMDAVFTIGQYNLVSWALNSFGVPLDDYLPGANKNA